MKPIDELFKEINSLKENIDEHENQLNNWEHDDTSYPYAKWKNEAAEHPEKMWKSESPDHPEKIRRRT